LNKKTQESQKPPLHYATGGFLHVGGPTSGRLNLQQGRCLNSNTLQKYKSVLLYILMKMLYTIVGIVCAIFLVSCGETYEIHASSETVSEFVDVQDMDIQEIYKDGKPIPLKEWKVAVESGDYTIVPVANQELRKRLSEGNH
jgi:hypothetical protein